MIETKIPNNIVEYKPKFLFGLTGKQFCCIAVTAVLIFLDYRFLKPYIGDLFVVLAAVPAAAAAAFGWITPYGMPFEKYLSSVLFQALLAPKFRRNRNVADSFVVPCDIYYEPIPDSAVAPMVMEHVNFVRESLGIEIENGSKNKKRKKARYKKSKQAIQ